MEVYVVRLAGKLRKESRKMYRCHDRVYEIPVPSMNNLGESSTH